MSLFLINPMPVAALAPLWDMAQASQVSLSVFSPAVAQLRDRLSQPGAMGLALGERERVLGALATLDQEASRYTDASGTIPSELLRPPLQSVAQAWPVRMNYQGNAPDDISNEYCIGQEVGGGGCSRVYHGYNNQTGVTVAIKLVDVSENPGMPLELAERALRDEYDFLMRLAPGTGPRVYRLGTMQGRLCMVMEYLDAKDLFERLGELHHDLNTESAFNRLLETGRQAIEAVAAVHRQGIVHADIKPENFKSMDGRMRLFDFGIAVRSGTHPTEVSGTPDYMPPESFHNATMTPQRDVFALGSLLYWLVTGQSPFPAGETIDKVQQILDPNFRPEPPSVILLRNRPDLRGQILPARLALLDAIISRALSPNLTLRYRDGDVLLRAMRSLLPAANVPAGAPNHFADLDLSMLPPPVQPERSITSNDSPVAAARASRRKSMG